MTDRPIRARVITDMAGFQSSLDEPIGSRIELRHGEEVDDMDSWPAMPKRHEPFHGRGREGQTQPKGGGEDWMQVAKS